MNVMQNSQQKRKIDLLYNVSAVCLFCVSISFFPMPLLAGSLDSPASPDDPNSALYSLEDVYNQLNAGIVATKRSGSFQNPTSGPAPTGHDLNSIMATAPAADNLNGSLASEVITGKTFWSLRTDGTWGKTIGTWDGSPICQGTMVGSRWCDNNNGTLLDMTTGKTWLKNGNCWGKITWEEAVVKPTKELRDGVCGLSGDGSRWGDWRLPTVNELTDLTNGVESVRVATPQAFTGIIADYNTPYWTSSTVEATPTDAHIIYLGDGQSSNGVKTTVSMYLMAVLGDR